VRVKIYHNPRCSKSRATLELLQSRGISPEIIEYLVTPPDAATLKRLLSKLGLEVRDIVRFNEQEFKDSGLDKSASNAELFELLLEHPKLIERPIVEFGERARIGRPPEQVLELFETRH
jgi:arsenate reductase